MDLVGYRLPAGFHLEFEAADGVSVIRINEFETVSILLENQFDTCIDSEWCPLGVLGILQSPFMQSVSDRGGIAGSEAILPALFEYEDALRSIDRYVSEFRICEVDITLLRIEICLLQIYLQSDIVAIGAQDVISRLEEFHVPVDIDLLSLETAIRILPCKLPANECLPRLPGELLRGGGYRIESVILWELCSVQLAVLVRQSPTRFFVS